MSQPADRCSAVPECSTLASASPDGSTPGCASPCPSDATCCEHGSPAPESSTTCEPCTVKLLPTPEASDGSGGRVSAEMGGTRPSGAKRAVTLATAVHHLPGGSQNPSTSSPEASPARAPAAPASARGSAIPRLFCGTSSGASLGRFDPDTLSSRTFGTPCPLLLDQASLLDPSGELCWPIWPRSGLVTSDGTCFPLRPSAPRTCVSGSSPLLPTTRHVVKDTGAPSEFERKSPELTATAIGLLPTPTAGEAKQARNKTSGRKEGSAHHSGTTLTDVAYEWSGASTDPPSTAGKPSTGLRLNPSFVGWMMGEPTCSECGRGWTDSDCPHSVTAYTSTSARSSGST